MKVIFSDINNNVVNALREFFGNTEVEIYHGDIFAYQAGAIVSPANSFGFMDGGIDYIYSKYFGKELQKSLQKKILYYYGGELLVGQATAIPTLNYYIPWLISAPTMRTPQNISGTVNVYLAFRAALREAVKQEFSTILTPGFGMMTGEMNPYVAAYQMKLAYDEVFNNVLPVYDSILQAMKIEQKIKGGLNV